MPLDAICLSAVVRETAAQVENTRIEKIQQPARDQVVLLLRGGRRLLLCAGATQPRLHLTEQLRDNPSQPPMFCMLLRKHLAGGRIVSVEQEPLERVVTLHIQAADELGEQRLWRLILEAMPRHANLILVDHQGRITDCLRRVDFEMSQQRQVLPGLFYHLPPRQEKRSPLEVSREEFLELLSALPEGAPLDGWLLDTFTALPPLLARELVCAAYGSVDAGLSRDRGEKLWDSLAAWRDRIAGGGFVPTLLRRAGRPADFTYCPITQYGAAVEQESFDSFGSLLDEFYEGRDQADRVRQKGQDLMKSASAARDRVRRKLAAQEKELAATRDRERLRISGELITANLYRMERGMSRLTAENYYEDGCPPVNIPLDVRLGPQENAARYFKQYAKAKTAERVLTEQLEKGREELTYLESVVQELSQAEAEQDFNDIRAELESGGYLKNRGKKQPGFQRASKPRQFTSSAGLRILVGRSNRQNDRLTAKDADRRDIWLHTQKIHGSHVILCTGGREPDETSLYEAACLAAYYSQGREAGKVPVDYTPVRYVKKPAGSRPGMVVYTTYQTIYAVPDGQLVKKLAAKA